ncbi:MAG: dipicolinate synthase, partial [Clostridiales bacterium]|nr:dipicolinate synthase [Clostridiales bacterium]
MKFAVIGGDMRQAKLAELLAADGHSVSTFAIDKIRLEGSVVQKTLIREATDDAACIIMPLPVTSREGMLNAPLSSGLHTTREILSVLRADQIICAGRIDCATHELADAMGITLNDYLEREELAVANAIAASEGAIQLLMEETPITICHAGCLVIGFGRIG